MTAKQLAQYFEDMTVALQEALRPGAEKPEGFSIVGSSTPQIEFTLESDKYIVLKQNPDRDSRAGFLARQGHFIGVIKDMQLLKKQPNALIGTVDLTAGTGFMPFPGGPVQKVTDAVDYIKQHPEFRSGGVSIRKETESHVPISDVGGNDLGWFDRPDHAPERAA